MKTTKSRLMVPKPPGTLSWTIMVFFIFSVTSLGNKRKLQAIEAPNSKKAKEEDKKAKSKNGKLNMRHSQQVKLAT